MFNKGMIKAQREYISVLEDALERRTEDFNKLNSMKDDLILELKRKIAISDELIEKQHAVIRIYRSRFEDRILILSRDAKY